MSYRIILFTISLCLTLPYSIPAQSDHITKDEIMDVIAIVSKTMEKDYVFPEIGNKMSAHIQAQLNNGAYDTLQNHDGFAAQLTKDLRSIFNDKHIRIKRRSKSKANTGIRKEDRDRGKKDYGFVKTEILNGNIGLIQLNGFSGQMKKAGAVADAAMAKVANADALIFDLRENGGGSPSMIVHITSYLFAKKTHLNSFYFRATDKITHAHTKEKIKGKRMDQVPVYILTSNYTFSAAEEFTYNLKHLQRATIIGEITGGGANSGGVVKVGKNFAMFVPGGRAINPITKTNWEGVGVIPHIEVSQEEALERAHSEAKNLLGLN